MGAVASDVLRRVRQLPREVGAVQYVQGLRTNVRVGADAGGVDGMISGVMKDRRTKGMISTKVYRNVTCWLAPTTLALALAIVAHGCATESEITRGRKVVASLAVAGVEVLEGFEVWDLQHQRAIVDKAFNEGRDPTRGLVEYRKLRDETIVPSIRAYTAAVRAAARALDAAEGGPFGINVSAAIDATFAAGASLVRVFQAVGYDIKALAFLLTPIGG